MPSTSARRAKRKVGLSERGHFFRVNVVVILYCVAVVAHLDAAARTASNIYFISLY